VFFSIVLRCHFLERGILKLEDCDCGMQPYLPAGGTHVCDDTGKPVAQLLLLYRVLSTVSRCHFLERGILKLAALSACRFICACMGKERERPDLTLLPVKVDRKAKLCVYGGL
jgi:hypothetical protein